VPDTDHLKRRAYIKVSQELSGLGVSPRYVSNVWRKHKEEILDPLNKKFNVSVKHQKLPGHPQKVSVGELHSHVKAVPLHFCKSIRTLSFKIGIPTMTLHRALKLGLLKSSKNLLSPS
jgi:hypothetical protein